MLYMAYLLTAKQGKALLLTLQHGQLRTSFDSCCFAEAVGWSALVVFEQLGERAELEYGRLSRPPLNTVDMCCAIICSSRHVKHSIVRLSPSKYDC